MKTHHKIIGGIKSSSKREVYINANIKNNVYLRPSIAQLSRVSLYAKVTIYPASRHTQESTDKCINQWNNI